MTDVAQPATSVPVNAWYLREIHGDNNRIIVEKLPCIENGNLATNVFAKPVYFGVAVMVVQAPQGQIPHRFQYEIVGATDPLEAFAWMDEQLARGEEDERAKIQKLAMRQRLMGRG